MNSQPGIKVFPNQFPVLLRIRYAFKVCRLTFSCEYRGIDTDEEGGLEIAALRTKRRGASKGASDSAGNLSHNKMEYVP